MENEVVYKLDNARIKVMIISPNKPLAFKESKGNLYNFQEELNSEYIKALELSDNILLFYPDDSPVTQEHLTGNMLVVKAADNDSYASLSQEDTLKILQQILPKLNFNCIEHTETGPNQWEGKFKSIKTYGSHFEIRVESYRTDILVLFGKSSQGWFACIPDYDAGCHLSSSLSDRLYNQESLTGAIGDIDGITVAYAIRYIAQIIS